MWCRFCGNPFATDSMCCSARDCRSADLSDMLHHGIVYYADGGFTSTEVSGNAYARATNLTVTQSASGTWNIT